MEICRILNRQDVNYPFARELYEDPLVVYHGTSSAYCTSVESRGLQIDVPPARLHDVREIAEAYGALNIGSRPMASLKALVPTLRKSGTVGGPIYFAQRFWFARDYATNVGGETVHLALEAAEEFLRLIGRVQIRDQDYGLVAISQQRVQEAMDRLRQLTDGGYPVVYAVRVEREWCPRWKNPYTDGGFCFAENNLPCEHPVPPENLLARADYVNGADDGYQCLSSVAMTWEEARTIRQTER